MSLHARLIIVMLAVGCSSSHSPAPNGQTHWLRACSDDADCGDLSCICGVCNSACANADACTSAVGEAGACRAAALASAGTCSDKTDAKRVCVAECSHDADCETRNPHMTCASGVCSLRVGSADSGMPMDGADAGHAVQSDTAPPIQCDGSPKQLVSAMVTITTSDPTPNNPRLVSSASGAHALAVWTDGGDIVNGVPTPEAIWAVQISIGASGAEADEPMQLTADGHCAVPAATADGFAVIWADATGLQLDRIRINAEVNSPGTPSPMVDTRDKQACPSALLDSDAGLIVAWYELGTTNEMLGRIDMNSGVESMRVGQVPATDSSNMALASLDGRTYLAQVRWTNDNPDTVISAIDWSKGPAEQSVTAGFFYSFFAKGDQLVLGMQDAQQMTLYAAAADEQPRVWLHQAGGSSAAADACGRVVALGDGGFTPGGVAGGFFAEPLEPAAPKVDLGAVTSAVLAPAGTQFAVLWYARIGPGGGGGPGNGTLTFATLSWH